jgi:hypothetical protein
LAVILRIPAIFHEPPLKNLQQVSINTSISHKQGAYKLVAPFRSLFQSKRAWKSGEANI